MATHGLYQLVLDRVPNLELSSMGSHGEMVTISAPLNTGNAVVWADIRKLSNLAIGSRP